MVFLKTWVDIYFFSRYNNLMDTKTLTVLQTDAPKMHPGKIIKNVGRPIKIVGALALKKRVDKYFKECDEAEDPYTISGLALALDVSRQTLKAYETKSYYGFGDILEKAKTRIENYQEKRLFGNKQCAGAIFALKNNFDGWIEKTETKVKGPMGDVLDYIQAHGKKTDITSGK